MNALQNWFQGINLQWLIEKLMIVVIAVISLTVHECSHALAAKLLGDDTAKRMGRLSLNPLRHLSWSGLLMLAVFHFGYAKPVPVDMRRFKNPKLGMALTSFAGPLSNIVLALIGSLLCQILLTRIWAAPHYGVVAQSSFLYYAYLFCELFLYLNAGLAVFNLIPVPPLDGSKILAMFLPDRAHAWLMRYERYGMIVLLVLLVTGVLDAPLQFLREGLVSGLNALTRLPFSVHPEYFYYL